MAYRESVKKEISKFKNPYESNAEWRIRKRFLRAHIGKFEENRLVCLSNCYVNARQMGCSYPLDLMQQLHELAKKMAEYEDDGDNDDDDDDDDLSDMTNLPSRIKGIQTVKFVQSTDQAESQTEKDDSNDTFGPSAPKKPALSSLGTSFVKATSEDKSTDMPLEEQSLAATEQPLGNSGRGQESGFGSNSMFDKKQDLTSQPETKFGQNGRDQESGFRYGNMKESTYNSRMGMASADIPCFDKDFTDQVQQKFGHSNMTEGSGIGSDTAMESVYNMPHYNNRQDWTSQAESKFGYNSSRQGTGYGFESKSMVVESSMDRQFRYLAGIVKEIKQNFGEEKNNAEIFQMAVDRTRMTVDYTFKNVTSSTFRCAIFLNFVEVSEGDGKSKKLAKHAAFDSAIDKLSCLNVFIQQLSQELFVLKGSNVSRSHEFNPAQAVTPRSSSMRTRLMELAEYENPNMPSYRKEQNQNATSESKIGLSKWRQGSGFGSNSMMRSTNSSGGMTSSNVLSYNRNQDWTSQTQPKSGHSNMREGPGLGSKAMEATYKTNLGIASTVMPSYNKEQSQSHTKFGQSNLRQESGLGFRSVVNSMMDSTDKSGMGMTSSTQMLTYNKDQGQSQTKFGQSNFRQGTGLGFGSNIMMGSTDKTDKNITSTNMPSVKQHNPSSSETRFGFRQSRFEPISKSQSANNSGIGTTNPFLRGYGEQNLKATSEPMFGSEFGSKESYKSVIGMSNPFRRSYNMGHNLTAPLEPNYGRDQGSKFEVNTVEEITYRPNPFLTRPKDESTFNPCMDTEFRNLSETVKEIKQEFGKTKNNAEILQMSINRTKMSMDCTYKDITSSPYEYTFVCKVSINFVEVSEAEGKNKKLAKHAACDSAVAKLSSSIVFVKQESPEKCVLVASNDGVSDSVDQNHGSETPQSETTLVCPKKNNSLGGDISKFIIFEHFNIDQEDAVSVLVYSCEMNKASLQYQYQQDATGSIVCKVEVEGNIVAEASDIGKIKARNLAAANALEKLKKICWRIKIKKNADCGDQDAMSRDEVLGDIQNKVTPISNSNIGNKMLQKMGWKGGGIGVEGNIGKAEPVAVSMTQIVRREGLGLSSAGGMKDFRESIGRVVENYAKTNSMEDLQFTPDFTKEERAYIHMLSVRLGLKSVSRGRGDDRYLILGRKKTSNELFDYLIKEGGSTHKYDLIPPNQDNNFH